MLTRIVVATLMTAGLCQAASAQAANSPDAKRGAPAAMSSSEQASTNLPQEIRQN